MEAGEERQRGGSKELYQFRLAQNVYGEGVIHAEEAPTAGMTVTKWLWVQQLMAVRRYRAIEVGVALRFMEDHREFGVDLEGTFGGVVVNDDVLCGTIEALRGDGQLMAEGRLSPYAQKAWRIQAEVRERLEARDVGVVCWAGAGEVGCAGAVCVVGLLGRGVQVQGPRRKGLQCDLHGCELFLQQMKGMRA